MTPALWRVLFGGSRPQGNWTPASIPAETAIWFKADDPGITIATGVNAWPNQGNLGGTATQSTALNQPALAAAALNGLPVVRFTAALSQGLATANKSLTATTASILCVSKFTAVGAYSAFLDFGHGSVPGLICFYAGGTASGWNAGDLVFEAGGDNATDYPRSVASTPASGTDTSYHMVRGDLAAAGGVYTTPDVYLDGTSVTLSFNGAATFGTIAATPINVGQSPGGNYWGGDIAEIVVLTDAPVADILKGEGYLAWKWGLQGLLPGGHPYKNAPP
jgi:hypothetical protein